MIFEEGGLTYAIADNEHSMVKATGIAENLPGVRDASHVELKINNTNNTHRKKTINASLR